MVLEPYSAADLGEKRVVSSETDVQTGTKPLSTLPDQDRPAGDDVAVVALHAQSLRVAVASVPRAALSLFVCHDRLSLRLRLP